jgi:hypothetical protein
MLGSAEDISSLGSAYAFFVACGHEGVGADGGVGKGCFVPWLVEVVGE